MPYYEKLRRDLRDTLSRKRVLDTQLSKLEDNIYSLETSYLEDTTSGNIIRGFDNYIKGGASAAAGRKKTITTEQNRLFTNSSISYKPSDVCDMPSGSRAHPYYATLHIS